MANQLVLYSSKFPWSNIYDLYYSCNFKRKSYSKLIRGGLTWYNRYQYYFTLITYSTFQCLRNALLHHPKLLLFFYWLNLLQSVYIHSIATGSCDLLHYMLWYLNKNSGVDWGCLHHWFTLDVNYRLIHAYGSIL